MTEGPRNQRIAFQGERGAFSEEAAFALLGPDAELVPRRTFGDLFRSLENNEADLILAPVENTITGAVKSSLSFISEDQFEVIDEVAILIEQHLIACPNSKFEELSIVQSHPVALAQCKRFFADNAHLLQLGADDTAGSVAQIMRLADTTRAAIAGRRAASLYGGKILREGIQDRPDNYTRFVLLKDRRA